MEIVGQIESIISEVFPGGEVYLDIDRHSMKISGILVWEGFGAADQVDRQTQLWNALRSRLGADATRISAIFTYTPGEYRMLKAS